MFTCLNCPDRFVGCHGQCERYQAAMKAYKEKMEAANADRKRNWVRIAYEVNTFDRLKKRKREKR